MLLKFGPQKAGLTGHLIRANMEAFRLEAGLSGQIFSLPATILPYMTQSWFMQTWQWCKELDIEVMMDIEDFETPRKQDREIMKIFLQAGVAGQDLICMNRCHMYLQAIFLLDICNGTGTAIDPRMRDGQAQCDSQYQ